MSSIFWNSSSMRNFFSTSLGASNTSAFSGMYSSLNDAALIKSGAYKKLMKSYISELKASSSSDTSSSSSKTSSDKTSNTSSDNTSSTRKSRRSGILEELTDHKPRTSSTPKNSFLDKYLEERYGKKTTTADGTVTPKGEGGTATETTGTAANTTTDATATTTTPVTEATAGAIIDEAV